MLFFSPHFFYIKVSIIELLDEIKQNDVYLTSYIITTHSQIQLFGFIISKKYKIFLFTNLRAKDVYDKDLIKLMEEVTEFYYGHKINPKSIERHIIFMDEKTQLCSDSKASIINL